MENPNDEGCILLTIISRSIREMVILFYLLICIMVALWGIENNVQGTMVSRPLHRNRLQREHLNRLIGESDTNCINQLRMDRHTFGVLCNLVCDLGGLHPIRSVSVEEMVAIFLSILAHDNKNRPVKFNFLRSGETVSRHFNNVLTTVLRLRRILLKSPEPILETNNDPKWRWFKNCVGALDDTYVPARVPLVNQARYRTHKGGITTNVLGVCDPNMKIIYVLPRSEGSAADSRILRDAVTRPNDLKVARVDAGYTNGEGFLAPFKGQRYHIQEFGAGAAAPHNPEELFNLRHSAARTCIERCFALLKNRWAILRSPCYYLVRTHNRIIAVCCLLRNLIRNEMSVDPIEEELPEVMHDDGGADNDVIDTVETSAEWSLFRNQLALEMYNEWIMSHGQPTL